MDSGGSRLPSRPALPCVSSPGAAPPTVVRRVDAFHGGQAILRVGPVPACVTIRQRLRRKPMGVDGKDDREDHGDRDRRGVWQTAVLEHDDREDDRGEPARTKPADERQGRPPGVRPEQRNRNRHHAYDCEAEHAIQGGSPGEIREHRSHDCYLIYWLDYVLLHRFEIQLRHRAQPTEFWTGLPSDGSMPNR